MAKISLFSLSIFFFFSEYALGISRCSRSRTSVGILSRGRHLADAVLILLLRGTSLPTPVTLRAASHVHVEYPSHHTEDVELWVSPLVLGENGVELTVP